MCPVCTDSSNGVQSPPPTLRETRDRDLAFRLAQVKAEYPEVISDSVHEQLLTPPPTRSPDTGSRSYNAGDDDSRRTQSPAWLSYIIEICNCYRF